ncbi:MAG TPA: hypothetical protein PK156_37000 [Polyangium sp.]|nr:hypothetical protein [Polyangium sp.]
MKQARNFAVALLGTSSLILSHMIGGCSAPDDFGRAYCDSNAFLPDPWCRDVDAGTDAESDGAPDGASFRPEAACLDKGGECVAIQAGPNASDWHGPDPVWFGPAIDAPTECPFEGEIQLARYLGLHAPPFDCATCECEESTGNCAGVPDSISVGTTTCGPGGISTPFDGPNGWDGSCTDANGIAAGAQCPPGSGTPCVQSIAWSAFPGPKNEACAVHVTPVPGFNGMTTSWENAAVACHSTMARDLCGNGSKECVPAALRDWSQCVWLNGDHKCPDNYTYSRRVMYQHEPKDSRSCSACSCGEPVGGSCVAKMNIFTDSACATEIQNQTISSEMPDCDPIFPAGLAIGSKSITDHLYVPGTCAASGGEPMGEAVEDTSTATTICCQKSLFFAE